MAEKDLPEEVAGIRKAISKYLDQKDSAGRKIGNSRFGVYAFYDYDGEPIYVGKTDEKLRVRIRRHMTNLRTLCSTCNQGAKNITTEKPTGLWLLSQIRRAGQDEQRAVFDWLRKKFGE